MAQKPSIPKGTRDFLPADVAKRNYLFSTMKSVFQKYGFAPIETPSFELSSTLLGKYGDEGDRLIFRILNSGEKVRKADLEALAADNLPKFANSLAEKALRYDLTVPFARFVVQHQHELSFPFKRYQIQPVWRADRPQHGRYQEFFQCDADVVGSDSLLHETDLIFIFDEVLSSFKLPGFTIHVNNRKILSGIAEVCGESEKLVEITVAIDKLDKIGEEGVLEELRNRNIAEKSIELIKPLFQLKGDNEFKINFLKNYLSTSEIGLKGIEEIETIFHSVNEIGLSKGIIELDVTLARGLNYYTGAIFEVTAHDVQMGSICGGGRYDDLTGLFGMKGLSGVGISFGADRIYDILKTLNLFPTDLEKGIEVMFVNFGKNEASASYRLVHQLRKKGISAELYPESAKIQKQMKYANDTHAQFVALLGESELKNESVLLKNMLSGEQNEVSWSTLMEQFKR
ncbi:MAG: histidine--tRNA ligase [Crocinitomicaceae bacterium]|nr:histidine--tRNA ligase [Crocinitomicaceae bacterium]MCF8411320.1 histidine--tRNA ligase [Crocinitomicaceae bacterium]MCF8443836.1 histidine--tRNA ligase [Crocinitomicaceae bacterium]